MQKFMSRMRFQLDHRWAPGHMSAYLDEELAARQRHRMERHVRECDKCRPLLAGLRILVAALSRLTTPEGGRDPVQLADAVRGRLGDLPGF
jgi:anti-sigma factor RsiW